MPFRFQPLRDLFEAHRRWVVVVRAFSRATLPCALRVIRDHVLIIYNQGDRQDILRQGHYTRLDLRSRLARLSIRAGAETLLLIRTSPLTCSRIRLAELATDDLYLDVEASFISSIALDGTNPLLLTRCTPRRTDTWTEYEVSCLIQDRAKAWFDHRAVSQPLKILLDLTPQLTSELEDHLNHQLGVFALSLRVSSLRLRSRAHHAELHHLASVIGVLRHARIREEGRNLLRLEVSRGRYRLLQDKYALRDMLDIYRHDWKLRRLKQKDEARFLREWPLRAAAWPRHQVVVVVIFTILSLLLYELSAELLLPATQSSALASFLLSLGASLLATVLTAVFGTRLRYSLATGVLCLIAMFLLPSPGLARPRLQLTPLRDFVLRLHSDGPLVMSVHPLKYDDRDLDGTGYVYQELQRTFTRMRVVFRSAADSGSLGDPNSTSPDDRLQVRELDVTGTILRYDPAGRLPFLAAELLLRDSLTKQSTGQRIELLASGDVPSFPQLAAGFSCDFLDGHLRHDARHLTISAETPRDCSVFDQQGYVDCAVTAALSRLMQEWPGVGRVVVSKRVIIETSDNVFEAQLAFHRMGQGDPVKEMPHCGIHPE